MARDGAFQGFQLALGRKAQPEERDRFAELLTAKVFDWPEAAQVLLMSNEFTFVD